MKNIIQEKVIQNTISEISSYSKVQQKAIAVREAIYNLLTTRASVSEKIMENPDFLMEVKQKTDIYSEKYKNILEKISSNFPTSENPAWKQFDCCKNSEKTDINFKIYKTLNPFEIHFLNYLPELFDELQKLGNSTKSNISFKIPQNFLALYKGNDNLVIHFSDSKNIDKIMKIVDNWMQKNNISQINRDFDRTSVALDYKQSSFTDSISEWYALKWLDGFSAESIVRGAVEFSQKPNFKI